MTLSERAILTTGASTAHFDHFSSAGGVCVPASQQSLRTSPSRSYISRGRTYSADLQDDGQPLPGWFDPLMQGFVDALTLPPNWDSYQAKTIDSKIANDALNFIVSVLEPTSPAPRVTPLSSGGIQLEWRRKGVDLEIVFDANDEPFFYRKDRDSGNESEHPLPAETSLLKSVLASLE